MNMNMNMNLIILNLFYCYSSLKFRSLQYEPIHTRIRTRGGISGKKWPEPEGIPGASEKTSKLFT